MLDWADGTVEDAQAVLAHTYASAGSYTPRVVRAGVTSASASLVVESIVAPPAASPLYVDPDPATINWGPPIVITDAYLNA